MKKFLVLMAVMLIGACSTKYILMDEDGNPVEQGYYADGNRSRKTVSANGTQYGERMLSSEDAFVVAEGSNYVTYQYKNVRVDEVAPLASLYCADIANGATPYLRDVIRYHNGFMRATFDCVHLAN